MAGDRGLTAAEMTLAQQTFTQLCTLGTQELDALKDFLIDARLMMGEGERILRVRRVDEELRREWGFARQVLFGYERLKLNRQRQSNTP